MRSFKRQCAAIHFVCIGEKFLGKSLLSVTRNVCIFNPRITANEYPFLIGCSGRGKSGKWREIAVFAKKSY